MVQARRGTPPSGRKKQPIGRPLPDVLALLQDIAPLELAEDWDNVGLLVEPSKTRPVRRVFLTIDLTDAVLEEALQDRADLVVAYHPPIFHPLRRLSASDSASRCVLRLIETKTALYSPHTAADSAAGGVNDWLSDGLGSGSRRAIARPRGPYPPIHEMEGTTDSPIAGQGRLLSLDAPVPLETMIRRVKKHLGLKRIRVAASSAQTNGEPVKTVAICAGAGADVILGEEADLLLTGEMRHHDVRSANAAGKSVILCDHTNTERGYLSRLRDRLLCGSRSSDTSSQSGPDLEETSDLAVTISALDRDPLEIR